MDKAQKEQSFETGMDEFYKAASANLHNNMKRTYDEYQDASLGRLRQLDVVALEALQNAVSVAQKVAMNSAETDNMVAKQAVRHGDLAIDRQWNVNETDWVVNQLLKSETFTAAIAGAVAKAFDKKD